MKNIGIIVGSLRKDSFNRKIGNYIKGGFPDGYIAEIVEIGDLSLYNSDLDTAAPPKVWVEFREKINLLDGFILVSPEYNRSVPAALKNAVDIGSRPPKDNVWAKKPGAIITSSPGSIGGFGANHHLRQTMVVLDTYILPQPEMYLNGIATAFDENGELTNDRVKSLLDKFINAFCEWAEKF